MPCLSSRDELKMLPDNILQTSTLEVGIPYALVNQKLRIFEVLPRQTLHIWLSEQWQAHQSRRNSQKSQPKYGFV